MAESDAILSTEHGYVIYRAYPSEVEPAPPPYSVRQPTCPFTDEEPLLLLPPPPPYCSEDRLHQVHCDYANALGGRQEEDEEDEEQQQQQRRNAAAREVPPASADDRFAASRYVAHRALACIVLWLCNPLFGMIAYRLAVKAKTNGTRSARHRTSAKRFGRASVAMSIVGIALTVFFLGFFVGQTVVTCLLATPSDAIVAQSSTIPDPSCRYRVHGRCFTDRYYHGHCTFECCSWSETFHERWCYYDAVVWLTKSRPLTTTSASSTVTRHENRR